MTHDLPKRELAQWLSGLHIVGPVEPLLLNLTGGLVVVLLIISIGNNSPAGYLLAASHVLLALVTALAAPRNWSSRCLGLLSLSLVHLAIFQGMDVPGMALLAWPYVVLALAALAAGIPALKRQRKFFAGLAEMKERDDFRWAVTSAPLVTRAELARRVRQVLGPGAWGGTAGL